MEQSTRDYQSFLAGNPNGLSNIIRDHKDGLLLYVNSFVGNLAISEELTEEVFVKLVLKRPRFRSESSFKTWLYAIGRNMALTYLRRNRYTQIPLEHCPELPDDTTYLEQGYIYKEELQLLHNAMQKLKTQYRQVLWLVYFEGFSHKEIARIMGKTVHNVDTLVYRARQTLKTKLLEEGFVHEEL